MNERIKELAEQAGCKVMDGEWYIPSATGLEKIVYSKGIGLEKFAELIVQECIDIIAPYTIRMSRPGEEYLHPILEIKKNFGVKE